jgi:hypothetical protein
MLAEGLEEPGGAGFRRRFRRSWPYLRWPLLVAAWLLPFWLGLRGFERYFEAQGESHSWSTLAYLSLQLFPMQFALNADDLPAELEVARFLAPLVAAGTPLLALLAIFGDRMRRYRLRFARDHVVICGLAAPGGRWPARSSTGATGSS